MNLNPTEDKHQAPSTKLQRSSKHQSVAHPIASTDCSLVTNRRAIRLTRTAEVLGFGSWSFSGAWILELGAFSPVSSFRIICTIVAIFVMSALQAQAQFPGGFGQQGGFGGGTTSRSLST